MARLIISSLFVASFVLSGVLGGILGLPGIPSKESARSTIRSTAGICKGRVNEVVTNWTVDVQSDPALTPACKACCEAAARQIRSTTIAEINTSVDTLLQEVDSILSILLNVLNQVLGQLTALVNGIQVNLPIALDNAKQRCIYETANVECASCSVPVVAA